MPSLRTISLMLIAAGIFGLVIMYLTAGRLAPEVGTVPLDSLIPESVVIQTGETNEEKPILESLPEFTHESLAAFNGEDPDLPIYIALDGEVYDVTEGREFYGPGGKYDYLAGTHDYKLLKIFGGSTIKKKYPVVGTISQ